MNKKLNQNVEKSTGFEPKTFEELLAHVLKAKSARPEFQQGLKTKLLSLYQEKTMKKPIKITKPFFRLSVVRFALSLAVIVLLVGLGIYFWQKRFIPTPQVAQKIKETDLVQLLPEHPYNLEGLQPSGTGGGPGYTLENIPADFTIQGSIILDTPEQLLIYALKTLKEPKVLIEQAQNILGIKGDIQEKEDLYFVRDPQFPDKNYLNAGFYGLSYYSERKFENKTARYYGLSQGELEAKKEECQKQVKEIIAKLGLEEIYNYFDLQSQVYQFEEEGPDYKKGEQEIVIDLVYKKLAKAYPVLTARSFFFICDSKGIVQFMLPNFKIIPLTSLTVINSDQACQNLIKKSNGTRWMGGLNLGLTDPDKCVTLETCENRLPEGKITLTKANLVYWIDDRGILRPFYGILGQDEQDKQFQFLVEAFESEHLTWGKLETTITLSEDLPKNTHVYELPLDFSYGPIEGETEEEIEKAKEKEFERAKKEGYDLGAYQGISQKKAFEKLEQRLPHYVWPSYIKETLKVIPRFKVTDVEEILTLVYQGDQFEPYEAKKARQYLVPAWKFKFEDPYGNVLEEVVVAIEW